MTMPDIDATAALMAAAPGVVIPTGLSRSLPCRVVSVGSRKLVAFELLSEQQGTHQRTWAN